MANIQAMCTSFKVDLLNGLHAFGASVIRGATTKDSFYTALYTTAGSIGAGTTAYSVTNEVTNGSGAGYTAGGAALTTGTAPTNDGTTAIFTPSTSVSWTSFTSAAAFDACLVYNNTAAGKNAVSTHTFGAQSVTSGTFTLTMPANAAATALIRIA